ncbi:MAG: LPS export ABC transporter permease LptG [Methylotetracoccus sp.]
MRILNFYIGRQVVVGSLLATLVLLTLLNFFSFADELGELGEGDYGIGEIVLYLTLTSPRNFYELMPSGALLGSLVMLGALANNRELVAMQAAGVSRSRIIWSALRGGLLLAVVTALIGEYVAPVSEQTATTMKAAALRQQVASRTKYGFWLRDNDRNVFINIRQIERPENLGDINIFELNQYGRLQSATHADKAVYDGAKWRLESLNTTRFEANDVLRPERKAGADWSSVLAPDLLNAFVIRPENLSAVDLMTYIEYLRENGQKSLLVEQAFWGRIVNPLVTIVMMLVAMPLVLGFRRDVSAGQRIMLGATLGIGFYLFDKVFGHLGLIYEMDPLFSSAFPALFALAAALLGLLQGRRAG